MRLDIPGMAALGVVLVCGGPRATELRAQAPVPLPIETALAQPGFPPYTPLALSPDGAWVAYTLRYPNHSSRATVDSWFTATGVPSTAMGARARITAVGTGRTLTVGDDAATSWGPSWSPDGRFLAYYSDADGLAHLWVREMASGRTRRVSDVIVRGHLPFEYPRWTPDSRSVVCPILPSGAPLPEASRKAASAVEQTARDRDSATVTVWRADPAQRYGGQFHGGRSMDELTSLEADLALVNVATGAVTTLAHGYRPVEYELSPTGRFLVFTSQRPAILRPRWTTPYDVVIVPLGVRAPTHPRVVAAEAPLSYAARSVLWSPDGATLLYSAEDSTGQARFFAADTADWHPRQVAMAGPAPYGTDSTASTGQVAWWDENGRAFYALAKRSVAAISMPEGTVHRVARVPGGYETLHIIGPRTSAAARTDGGRFLTVALRNEATKREGFARLDLGTGEWRMLLDEDRHLGTRASFRHDVARDGRMVFLSEDSQHPTDVWVAGAGFTSPRQLTHVAPEMERIVLGRTRLIDFTTASGAPRRATLLLPAGYREGERYPLVVYPYPLLSRSNDVNIFGVEGTGVENMQLLATRGFAVLAPDVPPFDWKDQMRSLASIIQRGVDRAIALGIADSTRLGIIGHSWGGYTVLSVIAQTDRFGAAVMRGGEADPVTGSASVKASGYAHGLQLGELYFGATVWEQPELYHRNSPLLILDRVRTPLLIIHGEGETTVPIFLADQTFAGLQRLGREVEFARYANENHSEGGWTHANQRDYLTRMIGWFESHLKGGSK